ncbi:MAG: hypothetical protein WAM75_04435 [Xanthobacteraceae bacterium]
MGKGAKRRAHQTSAEDVALPIGSAAVSAAMLRKLYCRLTGSEKQTSCADALTNERVGTALRAFAYPTLVDLDNLWKMLLQRVERFSRQNGSASKKMSIAMLHAGNCEQITWNDGNWLFLDVGFSANKSSSGLLIGDGEPRALQFGDAGRRIVEHVKHASAPTCLVIEAPLSVCFNESGNPTGRLIEKESVEGKTKTRYWHAGLGCSVMVAAMYLIRDIADAHPKNPVRLFEGFVSYKDRNVRTDHRADVLLLREVIKEPKRFADCIIGPDKLCALGGQIVSAFKVCGMDCDVPPIIRRYARDA